MSEQNYQPYRSVLLSRGELIEFNTLRPAKALADVAVLWGQILAAWVVAALCDTWWISVMAAMVVGNRYYSLFIIGHDGLHRRLHDRTETNDRLNDALILGAIGAITRLNRRNHMKHHASLDTIGDPDAFKYASRRRKSKAAFLLSFTAIPFVFRAVRNVFAVQQPAAAVKDRHTARDLLIIAMWQGGLLVGLTLAFGWWGYLLMWWLPVYVFTFAADLARVFCEHSAEDGGHIGLPDRLVTFDGQPLELALFAPKNMNHHTAHHLWPSIPYYNLPRATASLRARMPKLPAGSSATTFRDSYCGYLRNYLRGHR